MLRAIARRVPGARLVAGRVRELVPRSAGEDLGRVVTDKPGSTPRADWSAGLVTSLADEGHVPSSGAAATDPRAYPSFVTHLYEARRYRARLAAQGLKGHPRREITKKLQNHALAASHGITPPVIHAVWRRAEEIDLSVLPDEFVVKSNGGAGSRGVYPLRRVDGEPDGYEVADQTRRRVTGAEVVAHLTSDPKLSGPWFAEELLVPDTGGDGLPQDVKLYAFYGQVGYGFARRAQVHGGVGVRRGRVEFRYVDGAGQDIEMRQEASDTDVPLTPLLSEMLEHARTLSLAVPLPFVRVDLYGTTRGVVMGELTLLPGGNQHYLTAQDARLGRLWEEAEMRLQMDLVGGRPFAILPGDHPVPEILQPYLPRR